MAESLGTAVLRLEVDSSALREGLAEAKRLVQGTTIEVGTKGGGRSGGGGARSGGADGINRRSTRGSAREVGSPAFSARGASRGGPREGFRALEIAQERRFRISQRIEALEERGANVSRLRRRLGELTDAQSRRQFGTFRQISQELARQVSLAERKQISADREARAQRQLAAIGSRQGGARESVNALFDAQRRRYRLDQQIRSLEASGVNSAKLREQLGQATEAQARRNFGSAKQISDQLAFQLQKERDRLKVRQQEQRIVERQARIGGPRSPLRGGANIPGSPAFLQAQERAQQLDANRAARQGGARSPLRGDRNTPGSPAFIEAQAKEYESASKRAAAIGGARSPLRGNANIPGSPAYLQAEAERYQRDIARAAANGGASSPLRGSKNIPGSPAFLEAQAKEYQRDVRRAATIGGPSSPLRGNRSIPGSPAFIEAQAKEYQQEINRAASSGGPSSSIRGNRNTPGSPAFIEAQAKEYESANRRAAVIGGARSPLRGSRIVPGSPAFIEAEAAAARRAAVAREAAINRAARQGGASLPISGRLLNGGAVPGSPAAIQDAIRAEEKLARARKSSATATEQAADEQKGRFKQALGSSIIGGAFPLLFGQGIGASIGGAAGGGLGGAIGGQFGFGLSLVGTALGTAFDEALNKGKTLAAALDDPIGQFSALQEAALLSSRGLEKNIEALIASGRGAEAAATIQQDLASRYGDTSQLDELRSATDELGRAFSQLTVLTVKYVAGPLADFTEKLATSFNAQSQKQLYEERLAGLNPDQRRQVEANLPNARSGLGSKGLTVAAAAVEFYSRQNAFIDDTTGVTAKNEKQLLAARDLYNRSLSTSYRLIDAQTQGYERQTLELQKQQALQQRDLELGALSATDRQGPKGAKLQEDAALKVYEINQRIADLDQKRWVDAVASANRIASIQDQIAIEQSRPGLTGTGIGALQALAQFRETIRQEQNAQAALRASPGDTSLSSAAAEAAEQVKLSAAKTKADLSEAFKSAQEAVRSISRSIEDSITALNSARGSAGGINRYIDPQQAQDRQSAANVQLFREASRLGQQLGVNARFSGGLTERNSQLSDFINAARQELRGSEDIRINYDNLAKANNDLAAVNSSLVTVTTQLAEATSNLASKDWNVYVNVPGGNATGDVVGALNSRL